MTPQQVEAADPQDVADWLTVLQYEEQMRPKT